MIERFKLSNSVRLLLFIGLLCGGTAFVEAAPSGSNGGEGSERGVMNSSSDVTPMARDGRRYSVSDFRFRYETDHESHPDLADLNHIKIKLLRTPQGYVAPRLKQSGVETTLADLSNESPTPELYGSALTAVARSVVRYYNDLGYVAVNASFDPREISRNGEDIRSGSHQSLTMVIKTLRVGRVRTMDTNRDLPESERVNLPVHNFILVNSPLQASRRDLVRKDLLDEFIFRLNRHPTRRVDAHFSTLNSAQEIGLDYLVTGRKPWRVYANVSNTGTRSTNRWYQRAGFVHQQLTNRDDTLHVEYTTASFSGVHAVTGSYEFPVNQQRTLRLQVQGLYSEYEASQFAIPVGNGVPEKPFNGHQWSVAGRLTYMLYQRGDFFVDLYGTIRWKHLEAENNLIPGSETHAKADLFLPTLGITMERFRPTSSLSGYVDIEGNVPAVAGTTDQDLADFGRPNVRRTWMIMRYSARGSWYLEPLINRKKWEDSSTPGSSTLAHEVMLQVRGQYAFTRRLISQMQAVIGGMHTVRGYPQYVGSGDSSVIAGAEYRFHIPRILKIRSKPKRRLFGKPFRFAPQHVYGRPDWDFVIRGFFDYGHVIKHKKVAGETDTTLAGAGVGTELVIRENITIRADWGFALKAYAPDNVKSGDNRLHFMASILF